MAATYADEAFERLYTRYGSEVYRYALALLRNPAEAEDVTQTTFLNAYRALRAGQRPRRPHNWLIAIAHNACRSRVRFAMRRPKEVPLDDVVEQLSVPEADRPNIRELLHTIKRLPINQRAAITMRELEGRSYVDIAETLGVTVPAAEALIRRARRTLREQAARFRTLALLPSSVVAKVAALLVVGAVGTGVGVATGTEPKPHAPPALRTAAAAAARLQPSVAVAVAVTRPHPKGVNRPVAVPRPAQRPQIAVDAGTGSETTAAATTAGSTASTASTPTVETAGTTAAATVAQPITTVVSQLPTVTTPPATTPPVTTPVATVPSVTLPALTVPTVTVPPLP
ncbi:MAG TPA: RNA polymerase sigma factor [Gaiellaceae bacterium]